MVARAAIEFIADETGCHAAEFAYQLVDRITEAGID